MDATRELQELYRAAERCEVIPHGACPRTSVLIVDDEPLALKYMHRAFVKRGTVYDARTAKEALLQILGHDDIRVVVTDLRMPGEDGAWLIDKIAELHLDVEVVVVSAYSETMAKVKEKVAAVFLKPIVDLNRIVDAVSLLILKAA